MPQLGNITTAQEAGLSESRRKVVWSVCVDCGAERWVWLRNGQPQSTRCFPCGRKAGGKKFGQVYWGERASAWKGGRRLDGEGYVLVTIPPDDPLHCMTRSGPGRSVKEHRLVMARHLGRPLRSDEVVHHKNRDKADNHLENLQLVTHGSHIHLHQDMARLMAQNADLHEENLRLRNLLEQTTPS